VVAGGLELFIALHQRSVELVRAFNGGAEDGRADAVNFAAGGVKNKQALRGKGHRVELLERLGEGSSGLVGSGQGIHGVGAAEQLPCLVDQRRNAFVDDDAANGRPLVFGLL